MARAQIQGQHIIKTDKTLQAWLLSNATARTEAQGNGAEVPKVRRLADGAGLVLVDILGKAPAWSFEYRFLCPERGRMVDKGMRIGTYPKISLAVARELAQPLRDTVARGIDPSAEKKKKAAKDKAEGVQRAEDWERSQRGEAPVNSFEDVARKLHTENVSLQKWGEKAAATFLEFIDRNWLPLRHKKLDLITEDDLRERLDAYTAQDKHRTAQDMLGYANQIFIHGRKVGAVKHNIAADLKGYVKGRPVKNNPIVRNQARLGEYITAARNFPKRDIGGALELQAMLFQRPSNTCAMKWADVDFINRVWRVPMKEMKVREARKHDASNPFHVVPLPRQAMRLLLNQQQATGHLEYVFTSSKGKGKLPVTKSGLRYALKCLEFYGEMTLHGLRGTAQTAINDHLTPEGKDWNKEIEANLAHVYGVMGGTYNKAEHIEARRAVLQKWADHLDTLADGTWAKAAQDDAESKLRALQEEFGITAAPLAKAA